MTGETGAGKSILLDSLGLVLGNRAETSLIRQGEDKLSVTAVFEVKDKNNPLYALCAEYELETDSEITIKRSLNRDGKGKIFFNDQPVTAKLLKEIGKYLVEVHGQFDNQGLLNPANHRDVLDAYAGYKDLLAEVAGKFAAYKTAKTTRIEAENDVARARSDEEALRHWVDELEKSRPKPAKKKRWAKNAWK